MSTVLLDLENFVVTDTGDVIVRYKALLDRLRAGKSIDGLCTFPHDNVTQANQRRPQSPLRVATIDGKPGELPASLYEWKLPAEYRDLDLVWYLAKRLEQKFPDMPAVYVDRVQEEYEMMTERGMEDFLRLLIYIVDTFEKHDVVHGIGRGSACASLVLYLIGVHLVDPMEYDIPISEFLR